MFSTFLIELNVFHISGKILCFPYSYLPDKSLRVRQELMIFLGKANCHERRLMNDVVLIETDTMFQNNIDTQKFTCKLFKFVNSCLHRKQNLIGGNRSLTP